MSLAVFQYFVSGHKFPVIFNLFLLEKKLKPKSVLIDIPISTLKNIDYNIEFEKTILSITLGLTMLGNKELHVISVYCKMIISDSIIYSYW